MTILRTIQCNFCPAVFKEEGYNKGFPGWGHVSGLYNPETGEDTAHYCPECKKKISDLLNKKESTNDLG